MIVLGSIAFDLLMTAPRLAPHPAVEAPCEAYAQRFESASSGTKWTERCAPSASAIFCSMRSE